jgi:CRP-like cAMP-binding protein
MTGQGQTTGNNLESRIAAHPFMRPLSEPARGVLTQGAREEVFERNMMIIRAGQPANSMYLIDSGKVAIEAPGGGESGRVLQIIDGGSAFGWSWLYAPFTWRLQVRAIERTRVIHLDGGHILAACEGDHELGYEILKRVSQVLIERLHAAVSQPQAA